MALRLASHWPFLLPSLSSTIGAGWQVGLNRERSLSVKEAA